MSRRDLIHKHVRRALEKDGWLVTDDPLIVQIDEGTKFIEIDLGAERVISAEKEGELIAIEVKTFPSNSILNGFHLALGQYLDYRHALQEGGKERTLYLAVSEDVFSKMNEIPFIQRRIQDYELLLIVVDLEHQTITQWVL